MAEFEESSITESPADRTSLHANTQARAINQRQDRTLPDQELREELARSSDTWDFTRSQEFGSSERGGDPVMDLPAHADPSASSSSPTIDDQQKYQFQQLPARSQDSVLALLRCAILDPDGHEIHAGKSGVTSKPYSYRVVLSGNRPPCPTVNETWDLGYRLGHIGFTMLGDDGSWDRFRFRPEIIAWYREMHPPSDAEVRKALVQHFYELGTGDDAMQAFDAEQVATKLGMPQTRVMTEVRALEGAGFLHDVGPRGAKLPIFYQLTQSGFQRVMTDFTADVALSPTVASSRDSSSAERVHEGSLSEPQRPSDPAGPPRKPKVFIGSSSEGLEIAEFVQLGLGRIVEAVLWNQGVFGLSGGTLEDLVAAAPTFDFAVLILTPDDVRTRRGKAGNSPRDNVLFELGLFMGVLGRKRTFMVACEEDKLDLPTDLAGVTFAGFHPHSDNNLQAALGPVCTRLKQAMRTQGLRVDRLPQNAL